MPACDLGAWGVGYVLRSVDGARANEGTEARALDSVRLDSDSLASASSGYPSHSPTPGNPERRSVTEFTEVVKFFCVSPIKGGAAVPAGHTGDYRMVFQECHSTAFMFSEHGLLRSQELVAHARRM